MRRPGEREAVLSALRRKFTLSEQELDGLVALAEEKARTANGLLSASPPPSTSASATRRRCAWSSSCGRWPTPTVTLRSADENHLVSKVAGLLHVTHGEYIAAKLHAEESP